MCRHKWFITVKSERAVSSIQSIFILTKCVPHATSGNRTTASWHAWLFASFGSVLVECKALPCNKIQSLHPIFRQFMSFHIITTYFLSHSYINFSSHALFPRHYRNSLNSHSFIFLPFCISFSNWFLSWILLCSSYVNPMDWFTTTILLEIWTYVQNYI